MKSKNSWSDLLRCTEGTRHSSYRHPIEYQSWFSVNISVGSHITGTSWTMCLYVMRWFKLRPNRHVNAMVRCSRTLLHTYIQAPIHIGIGRPKLFSIRLLLDFWYWMTDIWPRCDRNRLFVCTHRLCLTHTNRRKNALNTKLNVYVPYVRNQIPLRVYVWLWYLTSELSNLLGAIAHSWMNEYTGMVKNQKFYQFALRRGSSTIANLLGWSINYLMCSV